MERQEAQDIIDRLAGGNLIVRLAEALVEVSGEVGRLKQPGGVALALAVKPANSETPEVIVLENITKKPPKRKPRGAILWAVDGGLHDSDPRQTTMELTVVASRSEPITRRVDSNAPITREA